MKEVFKMSCLKFSCICYDKEKLENLLKQDKIKRYAYILHDNDEKKEHFHLFIEFEKPRNKESVAKKLGVDKILVESVKDERKLIRYLIHKDNKEKYQYNFENIISNYNLENYFKDIYIEDEYEILELFINRINNGFNLKDIIEESIKSKNINTLKKYWNIIKYYYDKIDPF